GYMATAVGARQQFCREVFAYACMVTGLAYPPPAGMGAAQKTTYRNLAQLSVNIVDYIDIDDNITPFQWDPSSGEFVYGTELPRLVVNEVYAEIVNDPTDNGPQMPLGGKATMDYNVRFWIELNNPLHNTGVGGGPPQIVGGQYYPMPQAEGGNARL